MSYNDLYIISSIFVVGAALLLVVKPTSRYKAPKSTVNFDENNAPESGRKSVAEKISNSETEAE